MLLQVENLSKSYNKEKILNNINFNLDKGEVLTLLGKSGAGKTTILRCLNYLEKCQRGTIAIDGKVLCRDSDKGSVYASKKEIKSIRNAMGLVFQNFNLFPHMTVLENITESPVHVYNIKREEAVAKALELLSKLSMADKKDSYPYELSGGQRQRAAIARACALSPKILCFDEPTSALDPWNIQSIADIIEDLSKEGYGIIIVSHDLNFTKKISQRVIYIDNGKILEEGSCSKLFGKPQTEELKRFLKC